MLSGAPALSLECSDEAGKHARILTASAAVCTSESILQDRNPKIRTQRSVSNDHVFLALKKYQMHLEVCHTAVSTSSMTGVICFSDRKSAI
jgi:hypothetical protein